MIETGVNISLQDSASTTARTIANDFDKITESADGINSALDPSVLDDYNRRLTEIGETYNRVNSQVTQSNKRDQAQRTQQMQGVQRMLSGVGGAVTQAGQGDIGGAALSGAQGLTGMATKILGSTGGMVAMALLGAGAITNKLADAYGGRAQEAQQLSLMSDWSFTGNMVQHDINENSKKIRDEMARVVDSVAKYGKTFEEGAQAYETFYRAGGAPGVTGQFDRLGIGAYSAAYGANISSLAEFAGQVSRFRDWSQPAEDPLKAADLVLGVSGLGPAFYEEIVAGMQNIFTTGLSQGIAKSMSEIGGAADFFSMAGDDRTLWSGALGFEKMQRMNQAVMGATGLGTQHDLMLYRAASGLTEGGGLIETKMELEKGMTPQLFNALMEQYERVGWDKSESIQMLSGGLTLTTTEASQLYTLKDRYTRFTDKSFERALEDERMDLKVDAGLSIETENIRMQQELKQAVTGRVGAKAFDFRYGAMSGVEKFINFFDNLIGGGDDNGTTGWFKGRQEKEQQNLDTLLNESLKANEDMQPAIEAARGRTTPGGKRITEGEFGRLYALLETLIEETKKTTQAVQAPIEGSME